MYEEADLSLNFVVTVTVVREFFLSELVAEHLMFFEFGPLVTAHFLDGAL